MTIRDRSGDAPKAAAELMGWAPLPILGFARRLYEATRKLEPGREIVCYVAGGGDLKLVCKAKDVRVESPIGAGTTTVESMKTTAEVFLNKVRDVLQERIPAMIGHPHWTTWFPDEPSFGSSRGAP